MNDPRDDYPADWGQAAADAPEKPANVPAEAALLSALLISNPLIDHVTPIVRALDFFDPWHARIFDRIIQLHGEEKSATPVTLFPFFKDDYITVSAHTDEFGTFQPERQQRVSDYIATLTGGFGNTGGSAAIVGVRDFAEQIRNLSRRRQLHEIYRQGAEDALDTRTDVDPMTLIAGVDEQIAPLTGTATDMESISLADAWDEAFDEMQGIVPEDSIEGGFKIDLYEDWNAIAGAGEPGDLIYLGGRPSMGKTGVSISVALGAAAAGHPTEFLGLEMQRRPTMRRAIATLMYRQGKTSTYERLCARKLTIADVRAMTESRERLADWPFQMHTPKEMNVEDVGPFLRRRQRSLALKGKTLRYAVIDYLGRLGTRKHIQNSNDRVTHISRELKTVARQLGIVLIVLVQLSRDAERRDDKRPILADLRDSGTLEQDADVVVFVYRDEYYIERREPPRTDEKKYQAWLDEMQAAKDRIEVYSAKKREGALTKRTGFFFTAHQAIRSSNFYNSDLFRRDHQPGTFFEDGGEFPEERG